jgi:uncharacterized sulfatase
MDERIDLVRSVRDERYLYIRNYLPHRPHGQHVAYQFQTTTTRLWKELFDQGALPPEQAAFWEPRAPEELYDLEQDPDAVNNLARSRDHRKAREKMREANQRHLLTIRDVSFVPEPLLVALGREEPPRAFALDAVAYPLNRILEVAEAAARRDTDALPALARATEDEDPTIRYWAATGFLVRGEPGVRTHAGLLRGLLDDEEPVVRVVAAEGLVRYGETADRERALAVLLQAADHRETSPAVSLAAVNALDSLGPLAESVLDALCALPDEPKGGGRGAGYAARVKQTLCAER